MPAFAYLSDREIAVLRPYLDELAGLPGAAARQRTLRVPVARVGELIVKGTCHVCHDATSPNVIQPTVLSGMIPALGNIPHEWTIYFVVDKVTRGAPVPLGSGNVSSRGRMPVFGYLTDREAAAAYLYLIMYPPRA